MYFRSIIKLTTQYIRYIVNAGIAKNLNTKAITRKNPYDVPN